MDEHAVSGNNLWSLIVNFLTVTPERDAHKHKHKHKYKHEHEHEHEVGGTRAEAEAENGGMQNGTVAGEKGEREKVKGKSRRERFVSLFARLVAEHRKSKGASEAAKSEGEQ
ncbi:hypothetical protein BV20DRAFT_982504 [Pilatotrama ljubarskyi]|nr:hypothetical protein BV20DRAFT_982504 [Pilatotrama ljubarskyi]